jgi:hypothetical protein
MDATRYVTALQSDLAAQAALGGDEVAEAGRRLAEAAGPALQLRLQDLLAEAVLELNAQLPDGHVELRLAGRDPQLVYVGSTADVTSADEVTTGLDARITLRLPETLKAAVESAADREGISTNAWVVRALKREAEADAGRRGRIRTAHRLQGFAQS